MQKFFYSTLIFTLSILLSASGFAQGIYQLWGMTAQGGTDDIGVVFRADGQGNNAQGIYSFPRTNLGANPMYNQLAEYNEKFYSMTSAGGISNLGVIFEWDPVTNIYIKKYDFENADGDRPHGSLVLMGDKFYGMTNTGGNNNLGVIFEWDPATNIYIKKYDFDGANGGTPYGSLLLLEGKFYGMTYSGGTNNLGVIFEWDPVAVANAFVKKYDFDGPNGSKPYGDLTIKDGKFYGMASLGGIYNTGVIFEWDPVSNNYTKKLDLDHSTGSNSYGRLLLVNDKFYGMTSRGGGGHYGVIFEWNPITNAFSKKEEFSDFSGSPRGSLFFLEGKLYGFTAPEPVSKGFYQGHLFEFDLATNTYTPKYFFARSSRIDNGYDGNKPYGSLVEKNGKLYGMTSIGGSSGNGVIFEFDPATVLYKKRVNFNAHENGSFINSFTFYEDHLFGVSERGGFDGLGVIFEWDLATNSFRKKYQFDGVTGATPAATNSRYPQGKLTPYNGKLYGATTYSLFPLGFIDHIFEWNISTNQFEQFSTAGIVHGNLVESGGKLYGTHSYGGPSILEYDLASHQTTLLPGSVGNTIDNGLVEKSGKLYGLDQGSISNFPSPGKIFEWDIANSLFTVKYDFVASTGNHPVGAMLFYKDKYYGMTDAGGANNLGVIFEWDPVSNIYIKKYDFNSNDGGNPVSSLRVNNGKLYGMTRNGGSLNMGTIFEWDPLTNIYSKKSDFTGANGKSPGSKNALTVVPALAARGVPNSCINYAPVNIDNSNNNSWVPIIDDNGYAVAEIKANSNNLGIVNTSVFINNNLIREDGERRLYLDRNITITPQFQPTSPVDIRLYIRGTELETIKNAVNSIGAPSDIEAINELGIFKNDDNCGSSVIRKASLVSTTGAKWETDFVLSASVSNFSTFYFANKANAALPLTLLEFSGKLQNNNALLNWKTENELNTLEFIVERSIDGNQYKAVGTIAAANRPGVHGYDFTDPAITMTGAKIINYRLQQKDMDGQFVYSKIVTLSLANENTFVRLYPNPVNKELKLSISSPKRDNIQLKIIDASGKTIHHQTRHLATGSNSFTMDVSKIPGGVYYLIIQGNAVNKWMQFVKE